MAAISTESLIVEVIQHYFPGWPAPEATRYVWAKAHCPWHADEHPSASVSRERNAFNCHSCGVKGDAFSIIAAEEGISYQEANASAKAILGRSDSPIPPVATRKSSRRLFGESRAVPEQPRGREVPARVRRRTFGRP